VYANLAVLATFAFIYSLLATRLERTPVNGPVVYILFGFLAGPVCLGLLNLSVGSAEIRLVAELTLAIVLFSDATNANLGVLRGSAGVPVRMLLFGLPLTLLVGFGAAAFLFPELTLVEAAILSTMLAPTDAALGKAVVTNEAVPQRVREGLNVESGLNDGICVPVLFTFLALASPGQHGDTQGFALVLTLVAEEIGIGAVVGVALALAGAYGLKTSLARGWIAGPWLGLPIVALALAAFNMAQFAGGSGFIACFVGGLVFGARIGDHKHTLMEGAETIGEAFSLLTWVAFGAAVLLQHSGLVDIRTALYALLSLTVFRMLPIFLSLLGVRMSTGEKLFLGWFGPRGLASIVFAVIVLHDDLPGGRILTGAVVATVVASILSHGLSANPLARRVGAADGTETG
jgi:NhaP-type Na+/H+ or K+/H+ antiporter